MLPSISTSSINVVLLFLFSFYLDLEVRVFDPNIEKGPKIMLGDGVIYNPKIAA